MTGDKNFYRPVGYSQRAQKFLDGKMGAELTTTDTLVYIHPDKKVWIMPRSSTKYTSLLRGKIAPYRNSTIDTLLAGVNRLFRKSYKIFEDDEKPLNVHGLLADINSQEGYVDFIRKQPQVSRYRVTFKAFS
jgi:hypothetical protein